MKKQPICKICDQGALKRKKKYRMSVPVVIIGYIFIVPSILGMLIGLVSLIGAWGTTAITAESLKRGIRKELTQTQIPPALIKKVLDYEEITEADKASLDNNQRQALDDAILTQSDDTIATGLVAVMVGGVSISVIISSFVGGLIGWLLTMKKKVLQCISCGAVVSAS